MTHLTRTGYASLLALTLTLLGTTMVLASEVSGSLSSDGAAVPTQPAENLEGTVLSPSGGSSGGRSSQRSSELSDRGSGTVLGATARAAPGFPNAGTLPSETRSLWMTIWDFIATTFSRM